MHQVKLLKVFLKKNY